MAKTSGSFDGNFGGELWRELDWAARTMQSPNANWMSDRRYLIVNADDLGYSARVNGGIFEAHQRGIVTSASLMVRWSAAAAAVAAARRCPGLSLGLHLDLGEWSYCDGEW